MKTRTRIKKSFITRSLIRRSLIFSSRVSWVLVLGFVLSCGGLAEPEDGNAADDVERTAQQNPTVNGCAVWSSVSAAAAGASVVLASATGACAVGTAVTTGGIATPICVIPADATGIAILTALGSGTATYLICKNAPNWLEQTIPNIKTMWLAIAAAAAQQRRCEQKMLREYYDPPECDHSHSPCYLPQYCHQHLYQDNQRSDCTIFYHQKTLTAICVPNPNYRPAAPVPSSSSPTAPPTSSCPTGVRGSIPNWSFCTSHATCQSGVCACARPSGSGAGQGNKCLPTIDYFRAWCGAC
jgi:hypothetical protein